MSKNSIYRKPIILLPVVLLLSFQACISTIAQSDPKASSGTPWSIRMADADIIRNPKGWMLDFSEKPKWNYCHGLVCSAHEKLWERTSDEKYYNYIKEYADDMIDEKGNIKTYRPEDYNIDKINSGKFLFALYNRTKQEKYKNAIMLLRDQMRTHPRASEGGFWHKKVYPHQMWLDGLFMASPFLAQYAREFNEYETFDDVAKQISLITKHTRDEKTGLFYHGWDESKEQKWANKETGKSPHVWGRGMGWMAMTLVDVLDFFPQDHPKRKDILEITNQMAKTLADYQDKKTGLWLQVMDQGKKEGNYFESSASSMFVYFLIKAAKNGYIDEDYKKIAQKGYKGILDNFIVVKADGGVEITEACAGAGLGGTPYRDGSYEYYISEEKRNNDPKAVGPFIMLALEFEQIEPTKFK